MFSSITSRIPIAPVRRRASLGPSFAYSNSSSSITSRSAIINNGSLILGNTQPSALIGSTLLPYPAVHLGGQFPAVVNVGGGFRFYTSATADFYISAQNSYSSAGGSIGVGGDTKIQRDALGVFAFRDGTAAHSLRIYNTYTNASNYERGFAEWATSEFLIGTSNAGTGVARPVKFQTAGTTRGGITTAGSVYVGSGAAALATTATDGFLYIPTCAGLPTGTPTAITGSAPLVADSTNNRVYCYLGGAWVALN